MVEIIFPALVLEALVAQAAGYRRPTLSVAELVESCRDCA
ncbi:hypothetical protein SY94_5323 (plasmid) [Agrobacterium tumefaciens]|nr:hypothetical protein SY94_5323 [Agrobacterium tumefaciens]